MVLREEDIVTIQQNIEAAWNGIAPGYDRAVTSTHMWVASEGLRRAGLRSGMSFLDVAAGSGALSLPAARAGANVLATDVSPAMLELLDRRAREEGLSIETRAMDGHALDIDDDRFDLAGSQFGVMLFPDMPKGIREMVRVVKPGGRVLVHALGDPRKVEFFAFFVRGIKSARPGFAPPTDPPPLPFQLRDPGTMREQLVSARLKDVTVETVTENLEYQTGRQLWDWLISSNPVAEGILAELGITGEERETIQQALEGLVRERANGSGPAVLTVPVNIGIGTK